MTAGGIVAVRFSYDVPAGATLNINSKGAKAIYYRNAAITDGVIKAGDTATFIYSTYYRLISIDRDNDTTHSKSNFTLSAANWTSGSGITEYPYKYTLTVSGVTADHVVMAVLDAASAAATAKCGMSSINNSAANTVTFYSRRKLAVDLTGTLYYN